ncbi:MAG: sugar transferase [Acidobacteriota bacterium]
MIRLFRVSIPTSVLVLILSDTVIITACYVAALFLALNQLLDPWFYLRFENGWLQVALVVAFIQTGLYFMDWYEDLGLKSTILLMNRLCTLLGVAFLAQALIGYSNATELQLPQWSMAYGSLFVLVTISSWRSVFFAVIRRALPDNRLLFVGMSPSARKTVKYLSEKSNIGYAVVGYLDSSDVFPGVPYLGLPEELKSVAKTLQVTTVVFDQTREELGYGLLDLRSSGLKVEEAAQFYEMVFGRVSLSDLRPAQVLLEEHPSARRINTSFQGIYSFLLGCVGLVLFAPIMLTVLVLVKLTSPGPAIYRQQRVGKNGSLFYLYKFRSMYIDAEARSGPVWATKNDPRITPLGRWLRKLRLDELPQFFNVIRGEMALAGPRPERPEFCALLEKKIPFYNQRHIVKPGITGWAQVNHKYTETIEDTATKLEYDLYYVKHVAPALDAYIIFHTLKVMVLSRGAQ